jgi:hypothetical protein
MKARVFFLASVVAGLAASASAQDFNVDCLKIFGNPAGTYGAAAGQTGFWSNIDCWGGLPPQALFDTSGAATAVTLDHSSGFNFAFDNLATLGDDQALLDDAQCGSGNPVWTIANLAAGNYHVYAYAWAPDSPTTFFTNVEVVGGSAGVQVCGGAAWAGAHVDGVTYVDDVVAVTAGGSITINYTLSSGFITINGLQLDLQPSGPPPPTLYCAQTAPTVTQNCTSVMSFVGTPSASNAGPFTTTCNGLNANVNAIQFYGISGPASIPWSAQSTLCVKAPTQRLPVVNTGGAVNCAGVVSNNLNAIIAGGGVLGGPSTPGSVFNTQVWERDPASSKTTQMSQALEFTMGN